MKDLNKTLEEYLEKTLKIAKKVDKFVNGVEKQLVIEVGSHTTKVIEYIVKDKEIEVTAGALFNTPINAIENDRIIDINVFANILEQTLKEEKIRTKEFVVSIASKEIIIREMNVPTMKEKDLKNFVQINSKDIFPVKLHNYVLAYHIIEKGTTNRVMIAAIPKDIVEGYIQLGDKLGLSLKGINYSGYELYNFLDFEIGTNMSTYLAFDVGAKNTNIVIISNGALKFNKILPKGSEEISKFISEELNCSLTKAEQLKRQYNTIFSVSEDNLEENIVVKYTHRCVDDVIQDIQRIIEFFNSNNPKNKVNKIYVLGVMGKINGIGEYISNKLNVEVIALKLFNKVTFNKNAIKLKPRQQNFVNCLGTHELKERKFYFIKEDLKFKNVSFLLKSKFHKAILCLILIFLGIIVLRNNSFKEIENKKEFYDKYVLDNNSIYVLNQQISTIDVKTANIIETSKKLGMGIEQCVELLEKIDYSIATMKTDAIINVVNYKFQDNKIELKIKIGLPLGVDQNSPNYIQYQNLPFDIEENIEENINESVNIISNVIKGSDIEFSVKIEVNK